MLRCVAVRRDVAPLCIPCERTLLMLLECCLLNLSYSVKYSIETLDVKALRVLLTVYDIGLLRNLDL